MTLFVGSNPTPSANLLSVPQRHERWYHPGVSTNLRLNDDAVAALRDAARRTGRSQQDLLREAVNRFLGIGPSDNPRERAVTAGLVKAPSPFQDVEPSVVLPEGVDVLDLLDRDGGR